MNPNRELEELIVDDFVMLPKSRQSRDFYLDLHSIISTVFGQWCLKIFGKKIESTTLFLAFEEKKDPLENWIDNTPRDDTLLEDSNDVDNPVAQDSHSREINGLLVLRTLK